MRGWLLGGLSALMLMGAAGVACAQEARDPSASVITDEDRLGIASMAQQLDDGMKALGVEMGVDVPSFKPMFEALLGDVFKDLPSEGVFDYTVDFDMYGVTDEAGLNAGPPVEGERRRRPVYTDAQACAAAYQNLPVIHFERVEIKGLEGHRCTVSGQSATDEDIWIYLSWLVIEGPNAYLEVSVGAAAASEEEGYAFTSQIGLGRLDALDALAGRIQTLAIETYLASVESDETE